MTLPGRMDVRVPTLLPRSRLYHLAPLGVGTAQVESLTGYIARLAEEHCVPTSVLVTDHLLPSMRSLRHGTTPAATWLVKHGPHFNGTGDTARHAITALADLTGRQDLSFLTLQSWAQVLAPYGLLRLGRHGRAWCSACYAEALALRTPLYEPLLWSIASHAR